MTEPRNPLREAYKNGYSDGRERKPKDHRMLDADERRCYDKGYDFGKECA